MRLIAYNSFFKEMIPLNLYKKKHLLISLILLLFCLFLTATAATSKKKIVIAGSSSIVYWTNAPKDLSPHKVINKGVRGSTASEWNKKYYKRIVKLKPDIVVLFVGGNDFRDPEISGKSVAKRIQKMIIKLHKKLPKSTIYYISINPTPRGFVNWKRKTECNESMRQFCKNEKRVIYINTAKFCLKNGIPDAELYRVDGVHMNSKGYRKIWRNVVAKKIKKDLK